MLTWEASGAFSTNGLVKNQTGSPTVNPGRLRVAIMCGPTFPKHEKAQGSPWTGVPFVGSSFWLLTHVGDQMNLD